MRFLRANSPICFFLYEIGGFTIPMVTHHPYLEIELSSVLSYELHLASITKKYNQILAFFRRNL